MREKYIIRRPGLKDDLIDKSVNKTGTKNTVCYLVEMACNEMFGNFVSGFNTPVDMEKEFTLEKCGIGLFNRTAWDLYWNFELLRDGAAIFDRS